MEIRKISIGADYKSAMHYIKGQKVLGGSYEIHLISIQEDNDIDIWIESGDEVIMWKTFNSKMPVSIEYNINF
ncbi:MAG: hypothetical protein Unbinned1473contig1000_62 [Prokaryotic dsDNA virus sp.]|nr:MAG: hypothetical protein Unbinned1473contig1000_62 [Prokaryotic dsDNA virus sp.]|tara:strand:- start:3245 stop:3463 length:219 start_codon:yes stop_codon:yes gene_type:complete